MLFFNMIHFFKSGRTWFTSSTVKEPWYNTSLITCILDHPRDDLKQLTIPRPQSSLVSFIRHSSLVDVKYGFAAFMAALKFPLLDLQVVFTCTLPYLKAAFNACCPNNKPMSMSNSLLCHTTVSRERKAYLKAHWKAAHKGACKGSCFHLLNQTSTCRLQHVDCRAAVWAPVK